MRLVTFIIMQCVLVEQNACLITVVCQKSESKECQGLHPTEQDAEVQRAQSSKGVNKVLVLVDLDNPEYIASLALKRELVTGNHIHGYNSIKKKSANYRQRQRQPPKHKSKILLSQRWKLMMLTNALATTDFPYVPCEEVLSRISARENIAGSVVDGCFLRNEEDMARVANMSVSETLPVLTWGFAICTT